MAARAGRPLRAMAVMAAIVALWLAWRLPGMQADTLRLALALAPPMVMAAAIGPPVLLQAAPLPAARPLAVPVLLPAASALAPRRPLPRAAPSLPSPLRLAAVAAASAPAPQPPPAPPTPVSVPAPPATATGFDLANRAYALKQAGYRREAADMFDAALALDPDNRQWRRERAQLGRRWQAGGFALIRASPALPNAPGGGLPGFAASPVLGGGQLGGSIAFLPDPYARRPLAIALRFNMAADPAGLRRETAQGAIGLRQTLLPGVTLSAERLMALGDAARGDWTLRLAAGGGRTLLNRRLEAYGEAGMLASGGAYAGAQASAAIIRAGPATMHAATWASLQTGAPDAWRVDVGPSITADWHGVRVAADWRQRVAGNAAPGSGPVLTVSSGF